MKYIKFITGISVFVSILIYTVNVSGCGFEDEGGYVSSPFQIGLKERINDDGDRPGYEETLDFWEGYVKGGVSRNDIRDFFDNATLDSFNYRERYKFIDYLKSKDDNNALTYISHCLELNNLVDKYMGFLWDYDTPDKSEIQDFIKRINKVSAPKEFKPRYEFLKIRAYGAIKDNEGVFKVMNNNKKMPTSALRDRMEGYVGGVLYREGRYPEALDYFIKTGDRNSIEWCIEKLAGSDNLSKLYVHNPNSSAIPYILQNYMNYLIGSTNAGRLLRDNDSKRKFYNSDFDEISASDIKAQINEMKSLCMRVIDEGKSDNIKIWATALGVLQAIEGDAETALTTLKNAQNTTGDTLAAENLDNFTLWVLMLNSGKGDLAIDTEFAKSLEAIYEKMRNIEDRNSRDYSKEGLERKRMQDRSNNAYYDFLTKFMREEIPVHFLSIGKPQIAMGYLAMLEDVPSDGFSNFYDTLLGSLDKKLSLKELKDVMDYIQDSPQYNGPIDKAMKGYAKKYINLVNDVIGTRLMHEGKFKEALPYLAAIDTKWINTQPIAPYLRQWPGSAEYYDFLRDNTAPSATSARNTYNYKANYCAEMIQNMEQYETLSGDDKAKKALDIVAMCHFATPTGDGWALSDYTWSSTEPVNEFTDMTKKWINNALACATSTKLKNLAYYALLSIPDTKKESEYSDYYYEFPYGYTVTNNYKVDRYYLDSPSNAQMEGLRFISSNWDPSELNYTMSHCDVLKNYVAGRFINKPRYY